MLIDLSELDVAAMDTQRIIRDCEYVRELLLRNPMRAPARRGISRGPPRRRDRSGKLASIGLTGGSFAAGAADMPCRVPWHDRAPDSPMRQNANGSSKARRRPRQRQRPQPGRSAS
jgi:hypothetical protein